MATLKEKKAAIDCINVAGDLTEDIIFFDEDAKLGEEGLGFLKDLIASTIDLDEIENLSQDDKRGMVAALYIMFDEFVHAFSVEIGLES